MHDWEEYIRRHLPLPEMKELKEERIIREVAAHLEDLYREAISQGATESEARVLAEQRLGDIDVAAIDLIRAEKSSLRSDLDRWFEGGEQNLRKKGDFWVPLADLGYDLRHALRSIARRPGFTLISALILAIGIGAVTTVFSTFHGVVLRPMPFPEPDRLVWIWETTPEGRNNSVSALDFFDLQDRNQVFESVCVRYVFRPSVIVTGTDEPDRLSAMIVSAGFFSTLGIAPELGRGFLVEEMEPGSAEVVVLSYGYWQRRFAGNADVLGTSVNVNGSPCEVVGIMPAEFDFPTGTDLWVPLKKDAGYAQGRGNNNFLMIARMADGVSFDRVTEETDAIMAQIAEENPDVKKEWGMNPVLMHEVFYGSLRPVMLAFMAAVALVLLIACANISSLFLARATARQGEIAVRFAMGASRGRVMQHMLTESLIVAGAGGLLGLLLMLGGIEAIRTFGAQSLPRINEIGLNWPVLGFTVIVTVLTGLIFGIIPALRGTRFGLVTALREKSGATEAAGGLYLRSVLVIGQVALSLILLTGAGLLIRSLANLQRVNPGFPIEHLLNMRLQLPSFQYDTAEEVELFYTSLIDRLEAIPDITHAAASDLLPFRGDGPYNGLWRPENPPESPADNFPAYRRIVTDGYIRTTGIPLLAGREFEPTDSQGTPPVVMVNRSFVEGLFPGEQALGKTVVLPWNNGINMEIVGITGDVPESGPGSQIRALFYLPFRQYPQTVMELTIRCTGDPTALAGVVRNIVREADADVPIWDIHTMEDRLDATLTGRRFMTLLLGIFAAVALIMATMGIYGVLTYFVSQRTHEMGVRIALGADRSNVLSLVLRKGLTLTLIGIGAGLAGGLAFTLLLKSMLYGTAPTDPFTYGLVSVILIVVSVAACLIPASRAVRVDPLIAMRNE